MDKIAAHARERAAEDQARLPLEELTDLCAQGGAADGAAFVNALEKPGMRFICEVKKASPSKGIISKDFPYLEIAGEYEAAGADCISVLTDPRWFLGSDAYLREIAEAVQIPCLDRKSVV